MMEEKDPLIPLITPEQVAKSLQVSRAYIYKQVRLKNIPYYHLDKNIRFDPNEILEWLKSKANGEYHRDRLKRNGEGK